MIDYLKVTQEANISVEALKIDRKEVFIET